MEAEESQRFGLFIRLTGICMYFIVGPAGKEASDCLSIAGFRRFIVRKGMVIEMGKQTVKRRIFLSNALMVLVTLVILLLINAAVVKVYSESIEHELEESIRAVKDEDDLEDMIEGYTVRRNEFILLFLLDGVLCIAVLLLVSQIFTRKLADRIMEPLADGAERIRNHDLTQDVVYSGDMEFENVCRSFNEMREAILAGQEKNRKYEKARTDMIAGISHDMRTPLTAVRGTIKALLDGVASAPEQQRKFLETAYRRTGDMDVLLNHLFYVSKLETGNMPLTLDTIELAAFINNYVKGKRELLENEPVELTADTKGIAGYVSVDGEQLQRVFDNLLENSRKYGGVTPLQARITLERTGKGFSMSDASIDSQRKEGKTRVGASSEYQTEMVSPICRYEDIVTVQELIRKLRGEGAFANGSCGIHVHIDASPFDARTLRNITNIMAAKEDLIYKALQVSVDRQHRWCKPVEQSFLDNLNNRKPKSMEEVECIWYEGESYRFARNFLPKYQKNCRLLSPQIKKKEQIKSRFICTLPAPFLAVS